MKGLLLDYKRHWNNWINIKGNTENPRSSGQDPFGVLWRLIWCYGAGCTVLGRFFRVGRSCSVPDFTVFPRVVQCVWGWGGAGIFCRNVGFKLYENPSGGSRIISCRQTENRQAGVTELMVAFSKFCEFAQKAYRSFWMSTEMCLETFCFTGKASPLYFEYRVTHWLPNPAFL